MRQKCSAADEKKLKRRNVGTGKWAFNSNQPTAARAALRNEARREEELASGNAFALTVRAGQHVTANVELNGALLAARPSDRRERF